MASQLKVYVGLAHTLAPAGKCTARTARCSNDEDEARPTHPSFAFPVFAFLRALRVTLPWTGHRTGLAEGSRLVYLDEMCQIPSRLVQCSG